MKLKNLLMVAPIVIAMSTTAFASPVKDYVDPFILDNPEMNNDSPAMITPVKNKQVTFDWAGVYNIPGKNGKIMSYHRIGDIVEVILEEDGWVKIWTPDGTYYMIGSSLEDVTGSN